MFTIYLEYSKTYGPHTIASSTAVYVHIPYHRKNAV